MHSYICYICSCIYIPFLCIPIPGCPLQCVRWRQPSSQRVHCTLRAPCPVPIASTNFCKPLLYTGHYTVCKLPCMCTYHYPHLHHRGYTDKFEHTYHIGCRRHIRTSTGRRWLLQTWAGIVDACIQCAGRGRHAFAANIPAHWLALLTIQPQVCACYRKQHHSESKQTDIRKCHELIYIVQYQYSIYVLLYLLINNLCGYISDYMVVHWSITNVYEITWLYTGQ